MDSIKEELTKNNKKKGSKLNSSKVNNNTKSNDGTKVLINDVEGEYLDFSYLYFIYVLMNNVDFDEEDNKLDFFETNKLDKNMCQNIINQFNTNNLYDFPMQIISKDYNNILNKKKYINYMTNNIIETIKEKTILMKCKNVSKRQKQKQIEQENKKNAESSRTLSIATRKVNSSLKKVNRNKNLSAERRKGVQIKERVSGDYTERKTQNESKKGFNAAENVNMNKTFKLNDISVSSNTNMKYAKTIRFDDETKPNNKVKGKDVNT